MRLIFISLLIVSIYGCAAPEKIAYTQYTKAGSVLPSSSQLYLKVNDSPISYRGYVSYDNLNVEGGGFLYPANTAAMLLVSVLTHSVTVESIKNKRKKKIQTEADKALLPFQSIIGGFTNDKLIEGGMVRVTRNSDYQIKNYHKHVSKAEWVLESKPVFFMSDDQRVLLLKNITIVYPEKDPSNVVYKNLVEVVSPSVKDENPEEYWLKDQGVAMVDRSMEMFSESIEIVIKDIFNNQSAKDNKEQTFHYSLGEEKLYERGHLIAKDCNRMTIRTLRGWLKSVPIASQDSGCSLTSSLKD